MNAIIFNTELNKEFVYDIIIMLFPAMPRAFVFPSMPN